MEITENMRKEFNQIVENYYKNNKEMKWTTGRIEEFIRKLEEHEMNPTPQTALYGIDFYIGEVDGKKTLFMKENSMQIISTEALFDVIYEAHIATGHGNRKNIVGYFNNRYLISLILIKSFLKLCWCSTNINKITCAKKMYKDRGFLNILDVRAIPDQEYRYILCYQILLTKFSFFRPLKDVCPSTIAREMVKIFLTLGGAKILHSNWSCQFMKTIIEHIHKEIPDHTVIAGSQLDFEPEDRVHNVDEIENRLLRWMRINNSNEWSKGIYFVQFDMNCATNKGSSSSPYKSVFKTHVKLGFKSKIVPKNMIDSISEEKQFLRWRNQKRHHNLKLKHMKSTKKNKQRKLNKQLSPNTKETHLAAKICYESSSSDDTLHTSITDTSSEKLKLTRCCVCNDKHKRDIILCFMCNDPLHKQCGVNVSIGMKTSTIICTICRDNKNLNEEMNETSEIVDVKMENTNSDFVEVFLNETPEIVDVKMENTNSDLVEVFLEELE